MTTTEIQATAARKPLRRLNHFFWKYKKLFIPGLLCAFISAAFSVMVPMVVRSAVDSIPRFIAIYKTVDTPAASMSTGVTTSLLMFGALIVLLSACSGLFSFLMRQTIVVASRHVEYDLRSRMYDHLQKLSHQYYVHNATGDVITRATSDIEQVRRYIGPAIMYLARAFVVIVIALFVMFIISPRLTLFAIIPLPFLAVSVFFVARLISQRSDRLQKQYSRVTNTVQEGIAGIRVVKAFAREGAEARKFDAESSDYRERMLDLAKVEAAFRPVFILLVGMSTIIVVWVGGRLAMNGDISIGNIAEYIIYVALMTWPVAAMGFVISMIQRAAASMARLNEILDTEPDIADTDATDHSITRLDGSVSFKNVTYSFTPDAQPALDNVSLQIEAGSVVGIVGRTGSGKSTLVDFIPRVLEPQQGIVRVGGHATTTIPLNVLRGHIGYVPQDVFLFSDTVSNNIAFGNPGAGVPEIESAAKDADLLANIESFPKGFETEVGERGITVSGGQKQRTSIARALIRKPGILILDDALSAVDTSTEHTIIQNLLARREGETLIIVSHRISSVQFADDLIVMEDGKIVEQGTHAELVNRNGVYASMHRKQQLENEIAAIT